MGWERSAPGNMFVFSIFGAEGFGDGQHFFCYLGADRGNNKKTQGPLRVDKALAMPLDTRIRLYQGLYL